MNWQCTANGEGSTGRPVPFVITSWPTGGPVAALKAFEVRGAYLDDHDGDQGGDHVEDGGHHERGRDPGGEDLVGPGRRQMSGPPEAQPFGRGGLRQERGDLGARRVAAGRAEHRDQDGQAERTAHLLGSVEQAGGRAGLVDGDVGQRGQGERHELHAHAHAAGLGETPIPGARACLHPPQDQEEPQRGTDPTRLRPVPARPQGTAGGDARGGRGAVGRARRRVLAAGRAPPRPQRGLRGVQGATRRSRDRRPAPVRREPSHRRHDPERAGRRHAHDHGDPSAHPDQPDPPLRQGQVPPVSAAAEPGFWITFRAGATEGHHGRDHERFTPQGGPACGAGRSWRGRTSAV
jgi:hypothetical protein